MINLKHLSIGYQGQAVIGPLNGDFATGSLTAIIGANGTGKSTLLKTLAGLLPPIEGAVSFTDGTKPTIAYLPQQAELDRQFPLHVYEVVAMGCWPANGLLRRLDNAADKRIRAALERVGLEAMATKTIETLSGGQFQRMLFARLLVQHAPLILLDEPFTGIDSPTCALLMDVINQLHAEGHTLMVVIHDDVLVARRFPDALCLSHSGTRWGAAAAVLGERDLCLAGGAEPHRLAKAV